MLASFGGKFPRKTYEVNYKIVAVANATNIREDGLERRGQKQVMVSFVLLSWNVSGRTVFCHEEFSTIDVVDEKMQGSLFNLLNPTGDAMHQQV